MQQADVAIIGAGIVGLAQAWAAARGGNSVVLFERDNRAQGASIRNFGMVWPIGQPGGEMNARAMRSRERWLEASAKAGIWHDPCGSLHVVHRPDELAVLEEFAAVAPAMGFEAKLLTPAETLKKSPDTNPKGLLGGLWSPTEVCVDPRQAVARMPAFLQETYGVKLRFGTTIQAINLPEVATTTGERWQVRRAVVCSGTDFQTLYPETLAASDIRRCKLQMMRTAPQPGGHRIGPMLAGGLTLTHYAAFANCLSLPVLKKRIAEEMPEIVKHGIHVMASQNALGEVVIGDSHEYEQDIEIFDKARIDELILDYFATMARLPDMQPAQHWNGIYGKHPSKPIFTAEPSPNVHIVAGTGGAGMTLSFAYADELWAAWGKC
ncbi:TIGR03364 family FAD-dependent oxidoreductase [Zavarzinella formosa]|uniref:TIGR03364 family FAD-dependent oxidoreductase n=1 Tax=Zavarzinella formosa TaxID=360055 RepID=UPI000497FBAD|nr:TIGR03364 family FAD-dependent oxidoreductase [Zavarzinella formosa]